jgi:putative sterol carrier protein
MFLKKFSTVLWPRRAGPYAGKPDASFTFTDDDFLAISSGKLNPQMAFIR